MDKVWRFFGWRIVPAGLVAVGIAWMVRDGASYGRGAFDVLLGLAMFALPTLTTEANDG